MNLITLNLTEEQEELLKPILFDSGANTLFIAACIPRWQQPADDPDNAGREGRTVWRFQVVKIPAKNAQRIKKAILDAATRA